MSGRTAKNRDHLNSQRRKTRKIFVQQFTMAFTRVRDSVRYFIEAFESECFDNKIIRVKNSSSSLNYCRFWSSKKVQTRQKWPKNTVKMATNCEFLKKLIFKLFLTCGKRGKITFSKNWVFNHFGRNFTVSDLFQVIDRR